MQLSAPQIAAALALARMTQEDLASLVGITRPNLGAIINGSVKGREGTLQKIRHVLESKGIEFIGSIGVQWAQHQVRTLVGVDGLKTFFDDVRSVAKNTRQEICICGFSEDYFEKKLGEYLESHRKEMTNYGSFKMRCLIEEGDQNLGASDYCEYRWQRKEYYTSVSFYIYGDRTAIIETSSPEDPLILLIRNPTISQSYRRQFAGMWALASKPQTKRPTQK